MSTIGAVQFCWDSWNAVYFFTTFAKHSNLFLLERHQSATGTESIGNVIRPPWATTYQHTTNVSAIHLCCRRWTSSSSGQVFASNSTNCNVAGLNLAPNEIKWKGLEWLNQRARITYLSTVGLQFNKKIFCMFWSDWIQTSQTMETSHTYSDTSPYDTMSGLLLNLK